MPKRIIVCCDGTWRHPEQLSREGVEVPTNVVKTERTIATSSPDGTPQIVWYQKGLGTGSRFDRLTGGVFGWGLEAQILEAYRFLADNHEEGDLIYLLGYSRGAFAARSIAGMIRNVGLMRRTHLDRLEEAFRWYRSTDPRYRPRSEESAGFRRKHSREPGIHFLGAWDTAGSRGIPLRIADAWNRRRHGFHDMKLSRIVRNAFQALAIDERRGFFEPAIWEPRSSPPIQGQRIEQVWFAGVHGNVGGGYADAGLSDIACRWMIDWAEECGLAFDRDQVEAISAPDPFGRIHDSMRGVHRLNARHVRPIGVTFPETESLHPSVRVRMGKRAGSQYSPLNVLRYLEREDERR